MTKKEYQKPTMEVMETDIEQQILAGSVTTTGLDEEDLEESGESGNSWYDAY